MFINLLRGEEKESSDFDKSHHDAVAFGLRLLSLGSLSQFVTLQFSRQSLSFLARGLLVSQLAPQLRLILLMALTVCVNQL